MGYPAAFDFMFIGYYLQRFVGENPFGYSALDIKTYAMAMLNKEFGDIHRANMPKEWLDESPISHVALDDAISQGALFCNMLARKLTSDGPCVTLVGEQR